MAQWATQLAAHHHALNFSETPRSSSGPLFSSRSHFQPSVSTESFDYAVAAPAFPGMCVHTYTPPSSQSGSQQQLHQSAVTSISITPRAVSTPVFGAVSSSSSSSSSAISSAATLTSSCSVASSSSSSFHPRAVSCSSSSSSSTTLPRTNSAGSSFSTHHSHGHHHAHPTHTLPLLNTGAVSPTPLSLPNHHHSIHHHNSSTVASTSPSTQPAPDLISEVSSSDSWSHVAVSHHNSRGSTRMDLTSSSAHFSPHLGAAAGGDVSGQQRPTLTVLGGGAHTTAEVADSDGLVGGSRSPSCFLVEDDTPRSTASSTRSSRPAPPLLQGLGLPTAATSHGHHSHSAGVTAGTVSGGGGGGPLSLVLPTAGIGSPLLSSRGLGSSSVPPLEVKVDVNDKELR